MPKCWHGVDDELVTALEDEDDGLEEARLSVEPEAKFTVGPVVVIEGFDPLGPVRGVRGILWVHPVLERAGWMFTRRNWPVLDG